MIVLLFSSMRKEGKRKEKWGQWGYFVVWLHKIIFICGKMYPTKFVNSLFLSVFGKELKCVLLITLGRVTACTEFSCDPTFKAVTWRGWGGRRGRSGQQTSPDDHRGPLSRNVSSGGCCSSVRRQPNGRRLRRKREGFLCPWPCIKHGNWCRISGCSLSYSAQSPIYDWTVLIAGKRSWSKFLSEHEVNCVLSPYTSEFTFTYPT